MAEHLLSLSLCDSSRWEHFCVDDGDIAAKDSWMQEAESKFLVLKVIMNKDDFHQCVDYVCGFRIWKCMKYQNVLVFVF